MKFLTFIAFLFSGCQTLDPIVLGYNALEAHVLSTGYKPPPKPPITITDVSLP